MTHTLNDRESLLRAVLANRDDDAPRLIYADWLEENGETERAEFIRAAIADKFWDEYTGSSIRLAHKADVLYVPESVSLFVRRGFIEEVHCTERQWMGGECERCSGQGAWEEWEDRPNTLAAEYDPSPFIEEPELVECPDCHGTGHIVGIGPRLVREHPIERVVVTDKRPLVMPGWVLPYRWLRDDGTGSPSMLGDSTLDLVDDSSDNRKSFNWGKCFNTEQAARDAASAAYIEWAKRQKA